MNDEPLADPMCLQRLSSYLFVTLLPYNCTKCLRKLFEKLVQLRYNC